MLNCVIDLSHHNSADLQALKADGILAVIHKATQGVAMTDSMFVHRKQEAATAGVLWGAYHFGVFGDGANQARHFLQVAGPGGVLALDFENEPSGQNMAVEQADQFCLSVQQQTGKWPIIYADASHVRTLLAESTTIPSNCPLWLAEYGNAPAGAAHWPTPWKLWQYTDHSGVEGVLYDRDQFNGDDDELRAFWAGQAI